MKSYQKILISVFIGLIAFPAIGLGSSIVVSLIQGKTPAEAVHILAEQIDSLVGRVEVVETNQEEQEQTTSNIQSVVDQQQDIINQQKDLIEELQLLQQDSQTQISKEEACRKSNELLITIKETCGIIPFPGIDECITKRINYYIETNMDSELNTANKLKELKPQYLELKQECELLSQ